VSDIWRRRDKGFDLENELRRNRPEPKREFVRALTAEMRRHERPRGSLRLAFAGALTIVMLGALAAFGGIGYAANAPQTAVHAVASLVSSGMSVVNNSPASDQYKCNSGRGNLSETSSGTRQTDSSTLVNPHTGGTGPGPYPTDDCDPGNSGPQNRGGD
jgi:hypothetical protein